MEGFDHFKATKGGELFKGKLTRCKIAKANLTKSLTAFQNSVKDFEETETPTANHATKKRKAKVVMEGAEKMESRLENLGLTMEEFIVYVSGLGEDAFEAPTTPTTVMLGANSDMDDREKAMRDKLSEHEQVIRRAETVLSSEVVLVKQVVEKPEGTVKFSTFRQQADLKPSILEREANYAEARHFTEFSVTTLRMGMGDLLGYPSR